MNIRYTYFIAYNKLVVYKELFSPNKIELSDKYRAVYVFFSYEKGWYSSIKQYYISMCGLTYNKPATI